MTISRGKCNFCGKTFAASSIGRHLESCEARVNADMGSSSAGPRREKEGQLLHLAVKGGDGLSMYWMHVEINSDSTLKQLDDFLRKTWVECCGHLSQFIIEGTHYASMPDREFRDRSMKVKIGSVLKEGIEFSYEYDFGTTTMLDLKVLRIRKGRMKDIREQVTILARNDPPEIKCGVCRQKLATSVCAQCIFETPKAWLCKECSKRHSCGEEMLLPVVNSPRAGMCGYTGEPYV